MNELQVTARLRIHDGKLDEFKNVAKACLEGVREKDKGTLQYDWFFNEGQTECVVRERYVDSNAALEHMGNLGETLGALLGLVDLSLEICGTPSDELVQATEGIDIKYYSFFQGL